jgi:hypothetical protein
MLVEIDLREAIKSKLTFNQYVRLVLLYEDTKRPLDKYLDLINGNEILELIEYGYIEITDGKIKLTDKGKLLFEEEYDPYFEKFLKIFPRTVPTEFGEERVVGIKDINSKGAKETKKLWDKLTKKDVELKKLVLMALKEELRSRTNSNNLKYIRNVNTWLRNSEYEKYLDKIKDKEFNLSEYTTSNEKDI